MICEPIPSAEHVGGIVTPDNGCAIFPTCHTQYEESQQDNGSIAFAMKKWIADRTAGNKRKPIRPPKGALAVPPTVLYGPATAINVPSVLSVACGEYHTIVKVPCLHVPNCSCPFLTLLSYPCLMSAKLRSWGTKIRPTSRADILSK